MAIQTGKERIKNMIGEQIDKFNRGKFRFELLEWIPSTVPGDNTIFANYKITREPVKDYGVKDNPALVEKMKKATGS